MAVEFKEKEYAGRLISANTSDTGFAIVKATEVGGQRSVNTLSELYALSTPILSISGDNTNNDAIGQLWYVASEGKHYQLVDWNERKSEDGWIPFGALSDADKAKLDNALSKNGGTVTGEVVFDAPNDENTQYNDPIVRIKHDSITVEHGMNDPSKTTITTKKVESPMIAKSGGTSDQILLADGSVAGTITTAWLEANLT